jgi:hypothetical protein
LITVIRAAQPGGSDAPGDTTLDPRNSFGSRAEHGPAPDSFEQSLTQHQQKIDALKAVKTAQHVLAATRDREARAVKNAEAMVVEAERKALELGAYDLVPANLRPPRVGAGGAA